MTDTEREVLDAYVRMTRRDVAPTYLEVATKIGRPRASVHRATISLIQQGFLAGIAGKARKVRVIRTTGVDQGVAGLIAQYGAEAAAAEFRRQGGGRA